MRSFLINQDIYGHVIGVHYRGSGIIGMVPLAVVSLAVVSLAVVPSIPASVRSAQ